MRRISLSDRNYVLASPEGLCSLELVTAIRCMYKNGSVKELSVETIAGDGNCLISF
jgi:hypothetical protein